MTDLRLMWWVTVVAYWVVVVLSVWAAKRSERSRPWVVVTIGYAVLAINKQHDLTGLVTRLFRSEAWNEGWYGERGEMQLLSILGVCLVAGGIAVVLFFKLHRLRWTPPQRIALVAMVYLAGFALIRAISLHAVDVLLFKRFGVVRLNWVFELSGLLIAGIGALSASLKERYLPIRRQKG